MTEQIIYKVEGLDCAEEVAVLRKELLRRPGVEGLEFDVLNARMTVDFDPAVTSSDVLEAAVASTGMRAILWSEREQQAPPSFWAHHGRAMMTALSALFLAGGFLLHASRHGLADAFAIGLTEAHVYPPDVVALYILAALAGAWFVVPKAATALLRFRLDMNFLMTIAVIGAMIIGEWFEGASVAFLFAVALLLEHWSVGRARRAVAALMTLAPPTARYFCPSGGEVIEKPVEAVPVGVTAIVRPGERIPLDGVVSAGTSTVNQAPITGESVPVAKQAGDEVFAGTINGDGALEFQVTRPAADTTLARIIHLVQEAQSRRAPAEQWVDRFAHVYTPTMIVLAVLVATVPPLAMGGAWAEWFYRALVLLVIACPCALVISTPVSIVAGLTAAARHGVLIKGGKYLEAAGRVRALALDKTGTLTHGHPHVQEIVPLSGCAPQELLALAAALEFHSDHPLARAILRRAEAEGIEAARPTEHRAIPGRGAEARINGKFHWIGSHRLMDEKGVETPEAHARAEALEDSGHSVVAIGDEERVLGLISVADRMREGAPEAMTALKRLGVREVVMLTGDNEGTARAIAAETRVDRALAELLPQDKVRAVEELVAAHGQVAMVGDGVNDAPAMAVAPLGIAMGAMGTDVAIETADVALMTDDLSKLPWLIAHSRRTLRIIQQNIFLALAVKGAFVLLTLLGVASLWLAIAADMGVSLLVIFNGLRLLADTPAPPATA